MNIRASLPAAFAVLTITILLWRQSALEDDIDTLRAQLRAMPPAVEKPAVTAPTFTAVSSSPDLANIEDKLVNLESRIDVLENVSSDTARIVNKALDEKEARERARPKASWSAAQATGAPDTANAGDQATAWAPAAQDGGEEWLELHYANAVEVAQVVVRETYNPGTISKVSLILENGAEVPIWQGTQQAVPGPIDRVFPAPGGLVAKSAKVYLDTTRVPGWNEIDAVALTDRSGARQWAESATASSSYGASGGWRSYSGTNFGGDTDLFMLEDESTARGLRSIVR